jgi:hypothetical protein
MLLRWRHIVLARFAGISFVALLTSAALPPGRAETTPAERASAAVAAGRVDELLRQEVFSVLPAVDLAPITGDETFLRRITLDLVGRLPSPTEVTAFVFDASPDKRQAAVERLLARPGFGQNWGRYWRDVILYRRAEDRGLVVADAAEKFLAGQFNQGVGWDAIARSFISATGDVRQNGATAVIMAQMGDANDVTAEMSRIFLGVQIQCAQCHDHPTDRWKRQQFHELAAFFPRITVRPLRTGMPRSFEVVSHDSQPRRARPGGGMRRGDLEHYMPDLKDPESQGTLMTPVFFLTGERLAAGESDLQRRETLAKWLTAPSNPWFAKAFVNRLWSELVGEGFYEPVDDLGPDRACSAPETMDYLAGQFVEHQYDVKWLFRAITATGAYQRESRPRRDPDQVPFTANCSQRLRADQIFDMLTDVLGPLGAGGRGPMARPAGNGGGKGGPRGGGARLLFAAAFGYDPSDRRDEITGSIPQALLLMNSPLIGRAVNGHNKNTDLGKLLASVADDDDVVVELYLRCLGRGPKTEELRVVGDYLRSAGDRATGFEDVFWALINSPEFLHRR